MHIDVSWLRGIGATVMSWLKRTHPLVIMGVVFMIQFLIPSESGLWSQIQTSRRLQSKRSEKEALERDIRETRQKLDELQFQRSELERFARERFLMKAEDEDLFIIQE